MTTLSSVKATGSRIVRAGLDAKLVMATADIMDEGVPYTDYLCSRQGGTQVEHVVSGHEACGLV